MQVVQYMLGLSLVIKRARISSDRSWFHDGEPLSSTFRRASLVRLCKFGIQHLISTDLASLDSVRGDGEQWRKGCEHQEVGVPEEDVERGRGDKLQCRFETLLN